MASDLDIILFVDVILEFDVVLEPEVHAGPIIRIGPRGFLAKYLAAGSDDPVVWVALLVEVDACGASCGG